MATTFNVLSLGLHAIIDPTEGNATAENAGALVGTTFGSAGAPLHGQVATWSPGDFSGGGASAYDQTGTNDSFRINGGPPQTFDAIAL